MAEVLRFPWGEGGDGKVPQVWIIHCGSKSTPMIAQLCREAGLCSRIIDAKRFADVWRATVVPPKVVILSGGDQSVYAEGAITIPADVLRAMTEQCVVLGICYGAQLLAHLLGGKVQPAAQRESGMVFVQSHRPFGGYTRGHAVMNHGDEIVQLPEEWEVVASTERCAHAFVGNSRVWALQFHPEVDHTEGGLAILQHIAFELGGCVSDYHFDPADYVAKAATWMSEVVPEGVAICGLSGGVDSAVAYRIARLAGIPQLHGVFVDTGWMRKDEAVEVRAQFGDDGISYVDASARFYDEIEQIPYPTDGHPTQREYRYYDAVRKTMGGLFIEVFLGHARTLGTAGSIIQGTNIADRIESETGLKRHHNVGGLPDKLEAVVIEPLAGLFKFEIRQVAAYLGLDPEIVHRQPFPGPGLALRACGPLNRDIAACLQEANAILDQCVREHHPHHPDRPSQYYVGYLPVATTGLVGDDRVIGYAWVVRMVTSGNRESYITLDVFEPDRSFVRDLTMRLTNDVVMPDGTRFVRVFYEWTGKPPSTTELH